HTDASHIFERGADWGATALACNRVAELVLASAAAELEGDLVDAIARRIPRHALLLRRDEVLRILGQEIADEEIVRILSRLGFSVSSRDSAELKALIAKAAEVPQEFRESMLANADKKAWIVDPPMWRLDVEREIDLIEEIARIYGYNKFANTLPAFGQGVIELPHATKETRVRSTLLGLGYNEAISPTFVSPSDAGAFSTAVPVPLANPLSEEQSIMRTSLVSGMLGMLAWNLNRGTTDVRLFEMGNMFFASAEEKTEERRMICLGATGNAVDSRPHGASRPLSFFDLKGDITTLLSEFELSGSQLRQGAAEYYHPGRSAQAVANGNVIAQFGQIHPDVTAARKIKQEIYLAEVYLDRLFQLPLHVPRYQPLSRYPAVERDFSFVFSDSVTFAQIHSVVQGLNISDLQSFKPVEIFRGGSVPEGKYSVLLRAQFQSAERTLRDDEVANWSAQIIKALEGMGGTLRS
ncbi:MAG TPA: phenylalanine--tRNA ligase subunit beta, partial [Candidatus Angelobacter sp.]